MRELLLCDISSVLRRGSCVAALSGKFPRSCPICVFLLIYGYISRLGNITEDSATALTNNCTAHKVTFSDARQALSNVFTDPFRNSVVSVL